MEEFPSAVASLPSGPIEAGNRVVTRLWIGGVLPVIAVGTVLELLPRKRAKVQFDKRIYGVRNVWISKLRPWTKAAAYTLSIPYEDQQAARSSDRNRDESLRKRLEGVGR